MRIGSIRKYTTEANLLEKNLIVVMCVSKEIEKEREAIKFAFSV